MRKKRGSLDKSCTHSILDFPDFSFWTAPIGGRVHDDGVVVVPSADFAFYEFNAVIYDPADGGVCKVGGMGVFLGPCYHALGSVYMSDAGSGLGGCQGSASGVGKQV